MADGDRGYRTTDGDMMDLIAFLEYGISSGATEMLYDYNYRIADNPAPMAAGVDVLLPPYDPPQALNQIIRIWD